MCIIVTIMQRGKMIKKGDVVWCWERTPDDFRCDGFLALAIDDENFGSIKVVRTTPTGPRQVVFMKKDVELYCNKTDYNAEKIIMNTANKFKNLNSDEKRKMLKNIDAIREIRKITKHTNFTNETSSDPLPDPFSMPDEWDPGRCTNFEECWCGACGEQ